MKSMNIAISSNRNFYKKTLPILIPSLLSCGFSEGQIKVFVGGFSENKIQSINGIEYYFLDNNSIDATAFVGIVEFSLLADYWFFLHDTCKVGKKFKDRIEKPLIKNNIVKMALIERPSMNIGLYSGEYILSKKDKILSIKNTDYSQNALLNQKKWHIQYEDFLLWLEPPTPLLYPDYVGFEITHFDNWYQGESIRRTEYYPHIDLYKNKANWGQELPNQASIEL